MKLAGGQQSGGLDGVLTQFIAPFPLTMMPLPGKGGDVRGSGGGALGLDHMWPLQGFLFAGEFLRVLNVVDVATAKPRMYFWVLHLASSVQL